MFFSFIKIFTNRFKGQFTKQFTKQFLSLFFFLFCLLIFFGKSVNAQRAEVFGYQNPVHEILKNNLQEFGFLLNPQQKDFSVEVLFTQLTPPLPANVSPNDLKNNIGVESDHIVYPFVSVETHYFAQNPLPYFNPASLVKLPISLLGLEKMQKIAKKNPDKNINIFTRFGTKKAMDWQTEKDAQNLKDTLPPTIARYIEKMMLTSDNEAYIRMFEFLGQDDIHQSMREKSYEKTRIVRRFSYQNAEGKEINCDTLQNRYTNPMYFCDSTGKMMYEQEMQFSQKNYYPNESWQIPKNITPSNYFNPNYENYVPLQEAHHLLVNLFLNNSKENLGFTQNPTTAPFYISADNFFDLSAQNDTFLKRSMGAYPHESKYWRYDQNRYWKSYKKYLFYGRKMDNILPNVRIFNVVGWWAGSVVDCAYIVDYEHKFSFFLSAVFTLTGNSITENDGYAKFAFPFLENLGKKIYLHEKERRKNLPENLKQLYFDFWKK